MAIPELVKRLVEVKLGKYCENKFPQQVSDQIRLSIKLRGNTVFLIESRPAFIGPDWMDVKIAKFQYEPEDGTWELFWRGFSTFRRFADGDLFWRHV